MNSCLELPLISKKDHNVIRENYEMYVKEFLGLYKISICMRICQVLKN